MAVLHGNVQGRPALPHPAYERYVAVLDILGMKEWLKSERAQVIAEHIDKAFVACDQSSMGSYNGITYGPLLGTTHFSDTLLVWSPDDSWASLATMCTSVKKIVSVALNHGVPLRGSIAIGTSVCNPQTLRFVGSAIAEAYLWAEKQRCAYRSVGVDITPTTIEIIRQRLDESPMPDCWDCDYGILKGVLSETQEASSTLIWFRDSLFLNHWSDGSFTEGDPREMFLKRNLPLDDSAKFKYEEMQSFFKASRDAAERKWQNRMCYDDLVNERQKLREQSSEYLKVDEIRRQRGM